jgi:hypothetical protein
VDPGCNSFYYITTKLTKTPRLIVRIFGSFHLVEVLVSLRLVDEVFVGDVFIRSITVVSVSVVAALVYRFESVIDRYLTRPRFPGRNYILLREFLFANDIFDIFQILAPLDVSF